MVQLRYPPPQSEPPRPPKETLPTMYDLPSEDPEEPGLPDEFHRLQPRLLDATCRSPRYPAEQMFKGSDINLYYDVRHQRWYKRPDWFLVAGVSRLYEGTDLRLSYVLWQEGIAPLVVVEFLSPGTAAEDLGENVRQEDFAEDVTSLETGAETVLETTDESASTQEKPPWKWEVYERILRVPYYLVFSRYTDRLRVFTLVGERYQEVEVDEQQPQVWIAGLGLGLGLWRGEFEGVERVWLRWYDEAGNWILTEAERERWAKEQVQQQVEQAQQQVEQAEALLEQERQEKERLLERLRQLEGQ